MFPVLYHCSASGLQKLDQWAVLKCPLTTESAMKKIEDNNTLVFLVDVKAGKKQIRDAVQRMYDIKTKKINTLIRWEPGGQRGGAERQQFRRQQQQQQQQEEAAGRTAAGGTTAARS
jgi:ribosomal protein L23